MTTYRKGLVFEMAYFIACHLGHALFSKDRRFVSLDELAIELGWEKPEGMPFLQKVTKSGRMKVKVWENFLQVQLFSPSYQKGKSTFLEFNFTDVAGGGQLGFTDEAGVSLVTRKPSRTDLVAEIIYPVVEKFLGQSIYGFSIPRTSLPQIVCKRQIQLAKQKDRWLRGWRAKRKFSEHDRRRRTQEVLDRQIRYFRILRALESRDGQLV